jgi:hypothetical protein
MDKENDEKKELVFMFRRCSGLNSVEFVYRVQETEDVRIWKKSLPCPFGKCTVVGGRYLFTVKIVDNCFSVVGFGEYLGKVEDKNLVVQWTARDEAEKAVHAKSKKHQKGRKKNALYDCLEPIREAMRQTNHIGRRAIVATVLEKLYH